MPQMSEIHYYETVNGLGATSQLSPVTYFPDEPERVVKRFTRTKDGAPIFWFDYTIDDDTLYSLSIYVEPEYRDGQWLEYINFDKPEFKEAFEKGYEEFGKFSKTVWMGYNETPTFKKALEKRDQLSKKGVMVDSEIFMQGKTVKYHNTKDKLK